MEQAYTFLYHLSSKEILVAGNFTILTDRGCPAPPQTSRPRDLTITGLFNNNVLFTIICIQDITSAYNFALLIVPPIPILKTLTLVQKKKIIRPVTVVFNIIIASHMINLGFRLDYLQTMPDLQSHMW
jgi:hypothetical protein